MYKMKIFTHKTTKIIPVGVTVFILDHGEGAIFMGWMIQKRGIGYGDWITITEGTAEDHLSVLIAAAEDAIEKLKTK